MQDSFRKKGQPMGQASILCSKGASDVSSLSSNTYIRSALPINLAVEVKVNTITGSGMGS